MTNFLPAALRADLCEVERMKMMRVLFAVMVVLSLGVVGWAAWTLLKPKAVAAPQVAKVAPADAVDVQALGSGNAADRLWIEYFYRHRSAGEAAAVLDRIAAEDPNAATIRFFATIFRNEPTAQGELEKKAAASNGKKRAVFELVLSEAKDASATAEPQLLWAEYLATGEAAKLNAIIATFDLPDSRENAVAIKAARELLLQAAPLHADVYSAVTGEARIADGARLERLAGLAQEMETTLGEPVRNRVERAGNETRQGEFRAAARNLSAALTIFPDSARAQAGRATLAEAETRLDDAQAALERAVAIYPEAPEHRYSLARIQFMRRDYQAAVRGYEQAIEMGYGKSFAWHALGRAYQEKGDRANAIRCFQEYLRVEPHGPNEGLVRQYLISVGVPVADDPNDLVAMLHRADYARLEEHLAKTLREKERTDQGSSMVNAAYENVCANPGGRVGAEQWIAHFETWARERPQSHFAHAAYGIALTEYAWLARGSGWSSSVTDEGRRQFSSRLEQAAQELERSYELDPSDPVPLAHAITVAMGRSLDRPEMEKQFQRGLAADPEETELYQRKLNYLMPKWHGSEEEMLGFAREVAASAPAGSATALILPQGHWELYERGNRDRAYFRRPGVWPEMKKVYAAFCAAHPRAVATRDWFALSAFHAGDYATAVREMETLGENWSAFVWGDRDFFNRVRAEAKRRTGG